MESSELRAEIILSAPVISSLSMKLAKSSERAFLQRQRVKTKKILIL
jgi:hypothetical protein